MRKLLLLFTGIFFVFFKVTTSNEIVSLATKSENLNSLKQWRFKPINIKKKVSSGQWAYFAIDNINLSKMGITNINSLHSYNTIEIPGLKIRYGNDLVLNKDWWNPKLRQLLSENWKPMFFKKDIDIKWCLESAATLWYNNAGDLLMRLAYRGWMINTIVLRVDVGGIISFQSGSVIKIY